MDTVKYLEKILEKNRNLDIATRLSRNPNYSVMRLFLQKFRVIAGFIVFSAISFPMLRKTKKITKMVKNTASGRNALVIAGGPSAASLNIEKIICDQASQKLDVFAMNWFTHTRLAEFIKPDFYVLSDPINRINRGGVFKNRSSSAIWEKLIEWKTTKVIIPHYWYPDSKFISNEIAMFIDDRELIGFSKSVDPTKPRGYNSLTALKTLAAALYLGYAEVYVIGLDGTAFKTLYVNDQNLVYEGSNNLADSAETPMTLRSLGWPGGMSDMLYNHSLEFLDIKRCFVNQKITNLNCDSMHDGFKKHVDHIYIEKIIGNM